MNVAGDAYDQDKKILKNYVEGEPWKEASKKKLLTNYFKQWAKENGYKGYGILYSTVEDKDFNSILSKGGIFKDKEFRSYYYHGDMTHIIQQYVITEWWKDHPTQLKNHPVDLLKWIGNNRTKISDPWEYLFESVHKLTIYKPITPDFRNAEEFNPFLLSPDCPFRVLHQLIKSRFDKGLSSEKFTNRFSYGDFDTSSPKPGGGKS